MLCAVKNCYLLTEYIPVKLGDMKQLTEKEAYCLLRAVYCGFNTIEAVNVGSNKSNNNNSSNSSIFKINE